MAPAVMLTASKMVVLRAKALCEHTARPAWSLPTSPGIDTMEPAISSQFSPSLES